MTRLALFLAALLSLVSAQSAWAEDRYFLLVFGAQKHPSQVRYTHTFGTFVHAKGQGEDSARWTIEQVVDISWMPQTQVLHPLRLRAEEGANLDLQGTLGWARCNGLCVSMWGPYEICPELFDLAVDRAAYLESGIPEYNVLDRRRRPLVLDCVHALSGVDPTRGRFHTRLAYGDIASYFVLHHLGGWIRNPCLTHDWVAERLGVFECSAIRRREYCEIPFSILPLFPPSYSSPRQN